MPRYYFYKMTADNGGAPCVENDLLSLAICKPMIRRTAREGDVLLGFAADSLHSDDRLIYVARVTGRVENGEYFRKPEFNNRPDCIYQWEQDHFIIRTGAKFHKSGSNLQHDLGTAPKYSQANVLLSSEFCYLGINGSTAYKNEFPLVAAAVEALKRGHRVNHKESLSSQLQELATKRYDLTGARILGKPSQPPPSDVASCAGECANTKQETRC